MKNIPHSKRVWNSEEIWQEVIETMPIPSKPLFRDHCFLLDIDKEIAQVGVRSKKILSFVKKRQKELERTLEKVTGEPLKVNFQVSDPVEPHQKLQAHIKRETGSDLTDGQAIALQSIFDFLESTKRTFCLTGFAGTGKTFMTQLVLQYCDEQKLKVALGSPTNKAAKVLSQITGEDAVTIAKMLGIRPKIDKSTGKEIYAQDPEATAVDIEDYDLVILDEASMISSELLEILSQEFTLLGPKFLFLGDPAQLPPVGEKKSVVFDEISEQAHLNEVVRYSGAILNWATALRSQTKVAPVSRFCDSQTLIVKDDADFAETLLSEFTSDGFQADSDYCRVLAWTNASVARWNKRIRQAIFGRKAPRFMPGERLIATGACTRREVNLKNEYVENVILPSSGEVEVLEAHTERGTIEYGNFQADIFDYWVINAQDEDGAIKNFRVLAQEEEERLKGMLKDYASRYEWDNYWGLKKAFHPLHYAYALTVHRSQGSTFQKVFLDLRNLLTNRKTHERNKLLYTAATRGSEQMIVLE